MTRAFGGCLFASLRLYGDQEPGLTMRAETERTIEDIKQALSLLRRHL
jgi:hypothetical protein